MSNRKDRKKYTARITRLKVNKASIGGGVIKNEVINQ
jgi:hypothetical protein